TRFTDTRVGTNGTAISGGSSQSFNFLSESIPSRATALVANVTVLSGDAGGYLTLYPTTESVPPVVGDVSFASETIAQDFALPSLNGAGTTIFNSSAAPANLVIDAFGYFAPPPPGFNIAAISTSLPANGMSTSAMTVSVTTGSGVAF